MVARKRIATQDAMSTDGGQAWLMEGITGTEKPQLSKELGLVLLELGL